MEETLIRDVFFTNLIDSEIQKELFKKTVTSPRHLKSFSVWSWVTLVLTITQPIGETRNFLPVTIIGEIQVPIIRNV